MATATFKEKTITEKDVKHAIGSIKTVLEKRRADKNLVEFEGIYFPVKYVVSETYEHVTGKKLDPNKDFDSTEAIELLKELGFHCVKFEDI